MTNTMNKVKIDSTNLSSAIEILKQNGIIAELIQPKKKQADKIIYVNNHIGTCKYCHEEFDINQLTEQDLIKVKKSGLCLNCLHKLEELTKMKNEIKTIAKSSKPENYISPAKRVKSAFIKIQSQLTKEMIKNFQDAQYSKQAFGIIYPFLIDITGLNPEEKKEKRTIKNYIRYSPAEYKIGSKTFLMCNDIYTKNVEKFQKEFNRLNLDVII